MEFKKFLRTPNLRSAKDCSWNLFFHLDCPFNNLHFWLKLIHILYFVYHNLQFRLPILPYCQYYYNQNQSSGTVLQKMCFYKFHKIDKKTPKKRVKHRCFLVNFAKFLKRSFLKNPSEGCFTINTRFIYCLTTTFCFSKAMSQIFSV